MYFLSIGTNFDLYFCFCTVECRFFLFKFVFHLIDKVLGFFLRFFFVEGVEEVFEDDALTLQKSIGSILASLACLEGDKSTVKTTALLFFLLTFASSAKFRES